MNMNFLPGEIKAEVKVHRADGSVETHKAIDIEMDEEIEKEIENYVLLRKAQILSHLF